MRSWRELFPLFRLVSSVSIAEYLLKDSTAEKDTFLWQGWTVHARTFFRLPEDDPASFLAQIQDLLLDPEAPIISVVGGDAGGTHVSVLGASAQVVINADGKGKKKKPEETSRYKAALQAYRPILTELSQASGRPVHLLYDGNPIVAPGPNDGVIRIRPNSAPNGAGVDRYVFQVFDKCIRQDCLAMPSRSPAFGRGRVLKDSDDEECVQILGTDFYLLFPVLSVYHHGNSEEIFRLVLTLAWQDFLAHGPGQEEPPDEDPDAFSKVTQEWVQGWEEGLNDSIVDLDRKAADLQRRLASTLRSLDELRLHRATAQSVTAVQDLVARMPDERTKILALPGVARLGVHDDGVVFHTEWLHATHDGRAYRLGRYAVRFGGAGFEPTVWALETAHPKGTPHPHIGTSGAPCFGSATEGVASLLAAHKYADAAMLILRWLTEGYAPETADTKIEEWPLVDGPEAAS